MDPNDFLMGGAKTPGISWRNKPVGTNVTGTVCRESKVMQQRDPEDNEPLFWDPPRNTQPKMQLVIYIQTDMRDPSIEDDDGVRALYIKGKSLTEGMREAVKKSGRKGVEIGGIVSVTFTGEGEQKNKVYNPPKLYRVEYRPPADSASASFFDNSGGSRYAGSATGNAASGHYGQAPAGAVPAGLDPSAWASLDDARRASVLAAMQGGPSTMRDEPPF